MSWFIVHLAYPMFPFVLEGCIRWIANQWVLTFDTFNAATLSMSVGLLSIFVNQSLQNHDLPLVDETEAETLLVASTSFHMMAIVSFAFFGVLVFLGILVLDWKSEGLSPVLRAFQWFVFIGWVVPVVAAVVTQRSFKLRASVR